MEHPEITDHEDGDIVSIWVGRFHDRRDFVEYVKPSYSDESDDLPLSPFAADIGLSWYDEDFVESEFLKTPTTDLSKALAGCSHAETFLPVLAERRAIEPFNGFVLVYGYDHARYPQRDTVPRRVSYLGSVPFEPPRSTLERLERLEKSRADGTISEAEYELQRRRLLG